MATPFDLGGRTALVTGSGSGLGLAMARGLAEAGARVVLNGRDLAKLDAAAAALRADGLAIDTAAFDVTDSAAVDAGLRALVEALRAGTIAGAGLDVFENEPNVPAELLALDNVVLTPHVGSATWQTRQAMADLSFGNLQAHFAGKPLLSPVP